MNKNISEVFEADLMNFSSLVWWSVFSNKSADVYFVQKAVLFLTTLKPRLSDA